MEFIPYGRQNVSEEDIASVVEILKSDFLTQGPAVPKFENAVCRYVGSKHAVAVNSATSALHIACLALQVGPGDLVWTPAMSFVATSNSALYCGADVDFVDIDIETYNISVTALKTKLETAVKKNRLPKVLIVVHFAGHPCEMSEIRKLTQPYGIALIEDAAHAIGAKYRDSQIGDCKYSDITVFSFHPVKIITTGEGGMATTNNLEFASRMYELRSHGITRDPKEMDKLPDGPWFYQQKSLGFNYRLTDFQAALGLSQLNRLDDFVKERAEIFGYYNSKLSQSELVRPTELAHVKSAHHLYVIRVIDADALQKRARIFESLQKRGVGVNVHYIPIYKHPYYAKMGFHAQDFPNAETYYSGAITIPIFPGLSRNQQDFVIDALKRPIGHQNIF